MPTLILGAESLLGEYSGVGWYTWHLYRGLRMRRVFDAVRLVANERWVSEQELALTKNGLGPIAVPDDASCRHHGGEEGSGLPDSPAAPDHLMSPKPRRPGSGLRRLVRAVPGAVELYSWMRRQRRDPSVPELKRFFGHPPPDTLYHEPNFVLRPFNGPSLTTIHDLGWIHYPQWVNPPTLRILERGMQRTLEHATRVITVSRFVAGEVERILGVPGDRISVTPLGVSADFHPRDASVCAPVLSRYDLTHRRYVLSVSTLDPRKNLEGLISAYAGLPRPLQARFPLVLVGGKGWGDALGPDFRRLQEAGLARWLGYVPDADLPPLYAGAATFAMPSHYEGFGLPLLEAMASAVPVLASNRASIPEVVGDAGLLLEPDDTDALCSGLERLLEDGALRERLAGYGLERASRFDWDTTVEESINAYALALGRTRDAGGGVGDQPDATR